MPDGTPRRATFMFSLSEIRGSLSLSCLGMLCRSRREAFTRAVRGPQGRSNRSSREGRIQRRPLDAGSGGTRACRYRDGGSRQNLTK